MNALFFLLSSEAAQMPYAVAIIVLHFAAHFNMSLVTLRYYNCALAYTLSKNYREELQEKKMKKKKNYPGRGARLILSTQHS